MLIFFIEDVLQLLFCITVAGIEPTTLPHRKCSTKHYIPSDVSSLVYFLHLLQTQSQKGDIF
jgi:hypothetical protein